MRGNAHAVVDRLCATDAKFLWQYAQIFVTIPTWLCRYKNLGIISYRIRVVTN